MLPRNAEEIYAICRNLQGFMIACLSYSVVLMLSGDAPHGRTSHRQATQAAHNISAHSMTSGAPKPSGTPSWRLAVCFLLVCTFLSDSVVRELLVASYSHSPIVLACL